MNDILDEKAFSLECGKYIVIVERAECERYAIQGKGWAHYSKVCIKAHILNTQRNSGDILGSQAISEEK